jgi:hypothetical protein
MVYRRNWREGDYLIQDDLTGEIGYASESVKDYRGNVVLRKNLLRQNPQDFVKPINDGLPVNPDRPRNQDSPLVLYPEFIGATAIPTPIGPASHLYNAGIGLMQIGSTFLVR